MGEGVFVIDNKLGKRQIHKRGGVCACDGNRKRTNQNQTTVRCVNEQRGRDVRHLYVSIYENSRPKHKNCWKKRCATREKSETSHQGTQKDNLKSYIRFRTTFKFNLRTTTLRKCEISGWELQADCDTTKKE